MRITAPVPGARVEVDDLFDEALYTHGDPHLAWQTLRAEQPVFWSKPGFWVATRHADVRRVLSEHETFTSERGTVLLMLGVDDAAGGKMLTVTDPPRHGQIRLPMGKTLSPQMAVTQTPAMRALVQEIVSPAWDRGEWDVAAAFARLPVAAVLILMDLPLEDVDPLLHWTYASIAPNDPYFAHGSKVDTLRRAHFEIMDYFAGKIRQRRRQPGDDFISHLLAATVDGKPMPDDQIIFNCYNLLVGAVITTPQAVTALMIALAERGRAIPPDINVATAVEEALRWSSPSVQFLRYATRDVAVGDTLIRAGEPISACIASANRDETVFERPFDLNLNRTPNRHLAFGIGTHRCAGHALGRVMLRMAFEEFLLKLDSFELAGPPVHLVSNGAAAIVSAPFRIHAHTHVLAP
ncbi:cytochrome P450 [Lentzea sp. NBRC 105346]|uniref:cytochrome P450 n=1 Tax=Lentzea sp. NBRC 105346 TaxID=3032205 RepID=UPI0024A02D32|nr:cytochrome P450 [Lentzea sp. NBRC 105346]GLZ28703.1 cytochrome P450 [Lentzea sp. NBRC 105346]